MIPDSRFTNTSPARSHYLIPAASLQQQIEVKKSRFIAVAGPVLHRRGAMEFLALQRKRWPDARHYCWAYVSGNPNSTCSAAMSDDGEPSGTAGRPILNVLQHKKIGNIMTIVVRYFGGIKLGAGGLARAYSRATETVLKEIELKLIEPKYRLRLSCEFALEQALRHCLAELSADICSVAYGESVRMEVSIGKANLQKLSEFCAARIIPIELQD